MPVFDKSRYLTAKIFKVPNTTDKYQIDGRWFLNLDMFTDWTMVYWEEGDRLDLLAHRMYGDARLWWVIADVNDIQFPLDISTGTQIFVPNPSELIELLQTIGIK